MTWTNLKGGRLRHAVLVSSKGRVLSGQAVICIFPNMQKLLYTAAFLVLGILSIGAGPKVPALPPLMDEKGLIALLANKEAKPLLLDVRTQEEFAAGYIPGALLLPYDEITARFKEADKGRPIVVYCRSGRRSDIARTTLLGLGFTNVSDFGAYTKWRGTLATK